MGSFRYSHTHARTRAHSHKYAFAFVSGAQSLCTRTRLLSLLFILMSSATAYLICLPCTLINNVLPVWARHAFCVAFFVCSPLFCVFCSFESVALLSLLCLWLFRVCCFFVYAAMSAHLHVFEHLPVIVCEDLVILTFSVLVCARLSTLPCLPRVCVCMFTYIYMCVCLCVYEYMFIRVRMP